jgi:HEAT repeat protein
MPKVVTGVLDEFADHALDVPAPENTARHGVPSACGVCHKDKTPEALSASLGKLWPGAGKRQARRLRLADAIDEQTADKSEPALRAVLADKTEAPTLRAACALLLGQRFPAAWPAIVPLLKDPDSLLRARAVEALSYAKARPAADEIAALLADKVLWVRHTAALVLAMLGDMRAEAALRALARDPATSGLMQPHYALGMLALRQGDLRAATTRLEQAVTLVPYFVDALLPLADVHARRGDFAEARSRLEEALRFDPQNRAAKELLARLPE